MANRYFEEELAALARDQAPPGIPQPRRGQAPVREATKGVGQQKTLDANTLSDRLLSSAPGNPYGMTSVYLSSTYVLSDAEPLVGDISEQRVLFDVSWKTGSGGGDTTVDGTQGGCFTIPGAESINVTARIAPIASDIALSVKTPVIAEAMLVPGGAISPKPAYFTSLQEVFVAPASTGLLDIPNRASHLHLLSTVFAELSLVTVQFFASRHPVGAGAQRVLYQSPPGAEGIPILAGARLYRLSYTGAVNPLRVTPVWKLWL